MKKTRKVSAETLALMVELLPTIGSLRDLSEITGVQLDAVRGAVCGGKSLPLFGNSFPPETRL